MEFILPTTEEVAHINRSRANHAALIQRAGEPNIPLIAVFGPCAADSNRLPDGSYATEAHLHDVHETAELLKDVEASGRLVGVKSRTAEGQTGLIHESGGQLVYGRIARSLVAARLALATEIMDESDFAVAAPWLTFVWVGARTNGDTGVRYLARHTKEDEDNGILARPVYVKNDQNGELVNAMNAIAAIISTDERPRLRMGLNGPERVTTIANPHVGLLLRGGFRFLKSNVSLEDIIEEEVTVAQAELEGRFDQKIPVGFDISHDHAKREGGGEEGQLRVAEALINLMERGVIQIDLIMAETYLLAGNQTEGGAVPGLSTVDKCVREEHARELLLRLNKLQTERNRKPELVG
jgi:phospho-2-dehydro-3-deoxyheptonate aldolase